ncbi:MAG: TolC family protein, partial [Gemmatimonadales bacterium]
MFLLLPVLAIGGSVAPAGDTTRVHFTQAAFVALVEAANPELTAAREARVVMSARIGPVHRLPDPMVELGIMNRSLPAFSRESPVAMDQIRVAQAIPLTGRIGAATHAAEARQSAAAAMVEETRRRLEWRAAADLVELDRLDRTAAVLAEFGPALASLEEIARSRYAVGQGVQTEVIRAQYEAARFAEELLSLTAARRGAVARLNALAGRPVDARIDSVTLTDPPADLPPLGALAARSARTRPLLVARSATRAAAGFEVRRADREQWPDLELSVTYGQQPMLDRSGTDRMVSLMVGARLPIWSGSRQREMRREAEAMERMAAADSATAEADTRARDGELAAVAERNTRLVALYRGTLIPQARAAAQSSLSG